MAACINNLKGWTMTLISTFPILCEKCMGSLMSPANHHRGDEAYGLLSFPELIRMSNYLQMS